MKKKQKKQIKLRNKRLLKKYPFLTPVYWNGERMPVKEYGYKYTAFDDISTGWRRAFGDFLLKDICTALKNNNMPLGGLFFGQIKEKFGELRIYTSGGSNKDVERVIEDYSAISRNICIYCGKPDVPIITKGWICPCCKKCYENTPYNNKRAYEDIVSEQDTIPDEYEIIKWSKENLENIKISIKNKADKIRKKYYKNHKEN